MELTTPNPIPFTIVEGRITALKVGAEIITTPPIPFENFGCVTKDIVDFIAAQEEYTGLDTAYKIMSRRLEEAKLNLGIMSGRLEGAKLNMDEAQTRLDAAKTKFTIALVRASNGHAAAPVEQPKAIKNEPIPETRLHEQEAQNESDSIPHVTLDSIMAERQAETDGIIEQIGGTPEAKEIHTPRIIMPPEQQPEKPISQWFLGKVNIPVWVDEHETEIYELLQRTPEFKEEDVKNILTRMEIPADQIDSITKELLQRIETNNLASPVTAKGIADKIYDTVLATIPKEFTDQELKDAILAQGISEKYIEETTQEILNRISGKDKASPGLIEKAKKLVSRKPAAVKKSDGKKK